MPFAPSPSYPESRTHLSRGTYDLAPDRYDEDIVPDLIRFQLLLATFAAWVNREQQANAIDYLREENRVLKVCRRSDDVDPDVLARRFQHVVQRSRPAFDAL